MNSRLSSKILLAQTLSDRKEFGPQPARHSPKTLGAAIPKKPVPQLEMRSKGGTPLS